MRGHFSPEGREPFSPDGNFGSGRNGSRPPVENRASLTEWCDRRLLARIHRYTINRLRAEIEPVSPADFMRFLFAWQHVSATDRLVGVDGLRAVIDQLSGFEAPAAAWERAILPARVERYESTLLDTLCLVGDVSWARASAPEALAGDAPLVVAATPIALFPREEASVWIRAAAASGSDGVESDAEQSATRRVLDYLRTRGASFAPEIAAGCGLDA